MTKISYVTISARDNFPHSGRPDLHLFDVTLDTLSKQTFQDFEYIVVDVCYELRKDYFKTHNYGLKIKHIPAAPNIWSKLGLVQTCHQFNKGIIHADGELMFFDGDSSMLHPNLMENLWRHYNEGYFTSLGFGVDLTYSQELYEKTLQVNGYIPPPGTWQGQTISQANSTLVPTDHYKHLGYNGNVLMDHRYRQVFEGNNKEMSLITPAWYYGISTAPLEALLKVNGFELAFDSTSALNDVDLGNRLSIAGYNKIAMFRDSYVIEAYAGTDWHSSMKTIRPETKCNYAMVLYSKINARYRANEGIWNHEVLIENICKKQCDKRDVCATLPHRGPFFNKNELELYDYWKKHGATEQLDLEVEREMRLSESDYQEGTFVNC